MRKSLLTLVIPTYERPDHLFRKLYHLSSSGWDTLVQIYDSSTPEIAAANQKTVERFSQSVNIEYTLLPQTTGYSQKIFLAVSSVSTPYVVVHSDDDFINPKAAAKCVEFLEANQEYASATGLTLKIVGPEARPVLKQDITVVSMNDVRGEDDPLVRGQRARDSIDDKIAWYNVWRTKTFIEVLEPITKNPYKIYTEHMLRFLAGFRGRTKVLDELYEVRTLEAKKTDRREHSLPGFEQAIGDALLDENFREDLGRFVDTCVSFIRSERPSVDEGQAKAMVMNLYLGRFAKPKKLMPERADFCFVAANSRAGKLLHLIARRARHLGALSSPRHVILFFRMLTLYRYGTLGVMLRRDPRFEYNIITLLSEGSRHSEAFGFIYDAFKTKPVHE